MKELLSDDKPQAVSDSITTDNAMVDEIYTVDEVAKILKVEVRTVQEWLKTDKMPGFVVGKEYRVSESQLQEFISKGGTGKIKRKRR